MQSFNVLTLKQTKPYMNLLYSLGYRLHQTQYGWDSKEGFCAMFLCPGRNDIELTTRNQAVQKRIMEYNSEIKLRKIVAIEIMHGSDRRISSIEIDGKKYYVDGVPLGLEQIDGIIYINWLCDNGKRKFYVYSKDGEYWIEHWVKNRPNSKFCLR